MPASMTHTAGGEFPAAVSHAGGLSVISGFWYTAEQHREITGEMKAEFNKPDLPSDVDLALP
ncbi:hypothetical protein QQS21_000218 [Conoideocrella luteorostrata]|uniref:Uncharacterized protein n=1 Tax=Conoideocrella luteorostrata TaxID=1105319 RepID=A0AAJ0D192_9HYPO|nr:hypothetical protein QQS21_000218 [Conoideocrella luteorostrata]